MRAIMIIAGFVLGAGAAQAASYDGNWSVLLSTDQGACDKAYRFPVAVAGGKISYTGQSGATAQGGISGAGKVSATFRRGEDTLSATGSVRGASGQGSWRSPSRQCSGSWTAEKR